MRVIVNGLDITNVRHDPRVAPHYRYLMRWVLLFVVGSMGLGPGIALGVIAHLDFLPWLVSGFFLFTLIFFIRATVRVSSAAKKVILEKNIAFGEKIQGLVRNAASAPVRRLVRVRTRCPNCGAAVSKKHITRIEDLLAVHCPYCDTLYPLEEAEPL